MTAYTITRSLRALVATVALAALMLSGLAPRPALADGAASTRNIILGAAALAAGIIIYNNVQHKHAVARNTVVGYTRDGGVVYSNGRIVYPNGRTLYASNGDGRACGYDDEGERCGVRPVAYRSQNDYQRDDRYVHDNGRHRGRNRHHGEDRHDGHDNRDNRDGENER